MFRLPEAEEAAPDTSGGSIVLRDPEGFSERELVLSEAALFLAAHFDGEHSLEQALDAFAARFGDRPAPEAVRRLEATLDEAFFLETETFTRRRNALLTEFLASPTRLPAHAGVSYPAGTEEAREAVAAFFERARSLEEPGPRPEGVLRGLVAPHIDLRVGGPCAALAYRCLAEASEAETVIVLGTGHACPQPVWAVLEKPFETPLGTVEPDGDACRMLAEAAGAPEEAAFYHAREHSIEFQAVFLAALNRLGRSFRMVPVLCGSIRDRDPAAGDPFLDALTTLLAERGARAIVVAGADLAHVGPRFGDPDPLDTHHLDLLEKKDRETLGHLEDADAAGFHASVLRAGDPRRICGLSPIYALLHALPGARGKVLRYEQAREPSGTVSYASAGFWTAS